MQLFKKHTGTRYTDSPTKIDKSAEHFALSYAAYHRSVFFSARNLQGLESVAQESLAEARRWLKISKYLRLSH